MTRELESRVALPPARELAAACAAVVAEWHEQEPPLVWATALAAFAPSDEVRELALINTFQWHLEDECRDRYDDTARLAALKRDIDDSNARRVRAIDALDERVARELAAPPDAPVALVTPGNLLDRISILELKRYHAAPEGEAAAIVAEQLADACDGLDRLLDDLAHGRERIKLYRTVKLYGPGA